MKKPSYNWRETLKQMEPGKDYTYDQLAKLIANTDPEKQVPDASQVRVIIQACGIYMKMNQVTGRYTLTEKGAFFIA